MADHGPKTLERTRGRRSLPEPEIIRRRPLTVPNALTRVTVAPEPDEPEAPSAQPSGDETPCRTP